MTLMSELEMDVYTATTGVQMTIAGADEQQYQMGKEFLTRMGANCGPPGQSRKRPEFFYLQDEQQLQSLLEFRKSLDQA
jgi:hypothetical protein